MKKLYRSSKNKVIAGVCGGVAEYFNVDPVLVRIIFLALSLTNGAGIIVYVIAMLVLPLKSVS